MRNDQGLQRHVMIKLEASWQELLELTTVCGQEGLVDAKLLQYELTELKSKIGEARSSSDASKQAACLEQCQRLLAYYAALRKQVQHTDGAGFPQQDPGATKPLGDS